MLWFWRRLVATAPIGPLAWEPPYAGEAAKKRAKKKKKKKKKRKERGQIEVQEGGGKEKRVAEGAEWSFLEV